MHVVAHEAELAQLKKARTKKIIMQYPLSPKARRLKREEQRLQAVKDAYKVSKHEIAHHDRQIEKKRKHRSKLAKKLKSLQAGSYNQKLYNLKKEWDKNLALSGTAPKKRSQASRAYNKDKRALDIKFRMLPLQNQLHSVDTQLRTLQRHHQFLIDTADQQLQDINRRQARCDQLFAETPKMPLSRFDIKVCRQKVSHK